MTRWISLIIAVVGSALVVAAPAWGDNWGADRQYPSVAVSPDLADRVEAVERARLGAMLDAREQSLGVAYERPSGTVASRRGAYRAPVVADSDRFRIDHSNVPVPVSGTSSGSELEWPQIGLGFAIGIVLMLALYLGLKTTRQRPLAH